MTSTLTTARTATLTGPETGNRFRRTVIAILAALAVTSLVVVGSSDVASAHEGHGSAVEPASESIATTTSPTVKTTTTVQTTSTLSARSVRETIDRLHLARINDAELDLVANPTPIDDDLVLVGGRGRTGAPDVDCFVDFDDDLVIQTYMADGAEDTFYDSHWYQKCFDDYYPAVAVKHTSYGHFHLGYEDERIGPCSGVQTDWGRKADPFPSDDDDITEWVLAPCVSDIDPVTEPRSGISPHLPGEQARILAYDGGGYLPFQLRTLKVVSGEVEVCGLPTGPFEAAAPGNGPWQCTTLDVGYYELSNVVPEAIEVRIEFLTNGQIDNIGVDLL